MVRQETPLSGSDRHSRDSRLVERMRLTLVGVSRLKPGPASGCLWVGGTLSRSFPHPVPIPQDPGSLPCCQPLALCPPWSSSPVPRLSSAPLGPGFHEGNGVLAPRKEFLGSLESPRRRFRRLSPGSLPSISAGTFLAASPCFPFTSLASYLLCRLTSFSSK